MVYLRLNHICRLTFIGSLNHLPQPRLLGSRISLPKQTNARYFHNLKYQHFVHAAASLVRFHSLNTRTSGRFYLGQQLCCFCSSASSAPPTGDGKTEKDAIGSDERKELSLEKLCADILKSAQEKDVSLCRLGVEDVKCRVQVLLACFARDQHRFKNIPSDIQKLLTERTTFLTADNFTGIIKALCYSRYGNWKTMYTFLYQHSDVVNLDPASLRKSVDFILGRLQSPHDYASAFQRNPRIFFIPVEQLKSRIGLLMKWFSQSDVNLLLQRSQSVWSIKDEELEAKMDLLHYTLDFAPSYIAKCSTVLEKSLFHIQMRHEFVVRAGLKSASLPTNRKEYEKNRKDLKFVPTIINIFLLPDAAFVKYVGEVSLDYESFKSSFEKELEKKKKTVHDK